MSLRVNVNTHFRWLFVTPEMIIFGFLIQNFFNNHQHFYYTKNKKLLYINSDIDYKYSVVWMAEMFIVWGIEALPSKWEWGNRKVRNARLLGCKSPVIFPIFSWYCWICPVCLNFSAGQSCEFWQTVWLFWDTLF